MQKIRKIAVVAAGAAIGGGIAYGAVTLMEKHQCACECDSAIEPGTLDAEADGIEDSNGVFVPNPDAAMTGVKF